MPIYFGTSEQKVYFGEDANVVYLGTQEIHTAPVAADQKGIITLTLTAALTFTLTDLDGIATIHSIMYFHPTAGQFVSATPQTFTAGSTTYSQSIVFGGQARAPGYYVVVDYTDSNGVRAKAGGPRQEFNRTLDRTWGSGNAATPGSGGGNVQPDRWEYLGDSWELWQVVPFLGTGAGVSGDRIGDCRIHIRNRDVNRGSMQLTSLPDRVILTRDGWTGSPWEFTRPTSNSKFTNAGSGNSARKSADYEPVHTPGANPTAVGISQGQTFTATLIWEAS